MVFPSHLLSALVPAKGILAPEATPLAIRRFRSEARMHWIWCFGRLSARSMKDAGVPGEHGNLPHILIYMKLELGYKLPKPQFRRLCLSHSSFWDFGLVGSFDLLPHTRVWSRICCSTWAEGKRYSLFKKVTRCWEDYKLRSKEFIPEHQK